MTTHRCGAGFYRSSIGVESAEAAAGSSEEHGEGSGVTIMWIIPPLPPGASRSEREWHRREVALTEREIKDVWWNACLTTRLVERIPPPGSMLQPPVVCSITLDDEPARFTVKLRRGQLPGDFHRNAARLALAFRVPAVEIVPLTLDEQWISVRLLEDLWIVEPDEELPIAVGQGEPQPVTGGEPGERRPQPATAGGPRSFRRGRHRTAKRSGERSRPARQPGASGGFAGIVRSFVDFWRLPEPGGAGQGPVVGS